MVKKEWIDKGFVDEPIAKELDLKSEIRELCRKKNAVIMAHYYTEGIIQDLADFVGDSLALAQKAAKTEADIIVMCGVHFMGETNKILCPDKKVLVPDLNATCSLAESCPADEFSRFVSAHPGHTVISYVNTTAATKAVTDVVVTSSNARLWKVSLLMKRSFSVRTGILATISIPLPDVTCCFGTELATCMKNSP